MYGNGIRKILFARTIAVFLIAVLLWPGLSGFYPGAAVFAAADGVPPAPTGAVVDDSNDTFGWTNVEGFESCTDYEYSVDSGGTWRDCTANPQPVGNNAYAAGAVQVRVKADSSTGRPAGEVLASGAPFTFTGASDTTAPTVAYGTISASSLTDTGVTLNWNKATDDGSNQNALEYLVYRSDSDNIDTVENIETNGAAIGSYEADINAKEITGLSSSSTYYFNVIVKDEAENKTAYTMQEVTTAAASLPVMGGTVTVSGEAKYGGTLTVDISGITYDPDTEGDVPAYQWKRGGSDIDGATASTYMLAEADIGETIAVTVAADGIHATGSVTSAATAAVDKADGPSAPVAPVLASKTHNSVTLEADAAHEVRADGGAWQASNIFTGLAAETEYTFTARLKETATHKPSAAGAGLSVTTLAHSGDGTASDPYRIGTVADLEQFRADASVAGPKQYYILTDDIDLSGIANWEPINNNQRSIDLDGDGHVIRNLSISRTAIYSGLFGQTYSATTIRNLALENVNISGANAVGGLVGTNYASIANCRVTGSVTGNQMVGGLVGQNFGPINRCYASVNVSYSGISGGTDIGGLAGANVSASAQISDCYADGSAGGPGAWRLGGLVGNNYLDAQINQCYSTAGVNATAPSVGQLVGVNQNRASISSSYAVTGSHGLIGANSATVDAASAVKTAAELKQQATFTGWNFSSVWGINENRSYPFLLDVTPQPGRAATPAANPPAGEVAAGTAVTLSCATAGAAIYYTTDGNDPDTDSTVYTAPIVIDTAMTVKAVAVKEGMEDSAVLTAAYAVRPTAAPASIAATEPTALTEAAANDGSLASGTIVITIANGTLTEDISAADVTASNLPAGFDYTAGRADPTHLTISLTGKATSHAAADSVSSLTFTIARAKVAGAEGDLTTESIGIGFSDPAPGYSGGDGSSSSPYQITTVTDLEQVRTDAANGATGGKYYILLNDIDLGPVANWASVGVSGSPFQGNFDGSGYAVRNMRITEAAGPVGLFGSIGAAAMIENLNLEEVNIDLAMGGDVGGLASVSEGVVSNCRITGRVRSGTSGIRIGGLIGGNNGGSINDCQADVDTAGASIVGGMVGLNLDGSISGCRATGDVSAAGFQNQAAAGGLVGANNGGSISRSYAAGRVSGGGDGTGGLAGGSSGSIANCYATGTVSSTGDGAGGLAGGNSGSISNCYVIGTVSSTGQGTGALVGGNDSGGNINNSYAVAGSCPLVGYDSGTVTASAVKEAGEMKQPATFTGWDFSSVWGINAGHSYPFLLDVTPQPEVSGTDPADGAVDVSLDRTITVTFSENVQAGVSFGDISLTTGGSPVAVACGISGNVLTIDPAAALAGGDHTVTVPAAAIENSSGIPMAGDFSFSFAVLPPAAVNEVYVSPSGNDENDGRTPETAKQTISCGIETVSEGGTVYIADGLYQGADNRNITVGKSVTLAGQSTAGAVIDGGQAARIFTIQSGKSVAIQNMTLRNGFISGANGGAIYNEGDLTVSGCIFTGNRANAGGGAIAVRADGVLTVTGSVFTGNNTGDTSNYGGAIIIYDHGTADITDSTFTENTAGRGGAVYVGDTACSLTVHGCTFTGNTASGYGGAVYNYGTSAVTGSTFADNTAASNGGAISNQTVLTVQFCRLIGNKCGSTLQDIYRGSGTVNAEYNWWGTNDDPTGKVHNVTVGKWLVLSVSAAPAAIKTGETAAVTADLRHAQDGGYYDPAGEHVPDGTPVTYGATLGSLDPGSGALAAGQAATVFTAGVAGTAAVTATVDDQTVSCAVDIAAVPAPAFAVSYPMTANATPTGFDLLVKMNEAGTAYYQVCDAGMADPTSSELRSAGAAMAITQTSAETFISGLSNPISVAVDGAGNLYVADNNNKRVRKYDPAGSQLFEWTGFNDPQGVAVDNAGNLYVADNGSNPVIKKYGADGTFKQWGGKGTGDGQFDEIRGVAADSAGYVYAVQWNNSRVQKFTSDGEFVAKWGSYGSGNGQFKNPTGVAVDKEGNVYVADYWNHRIQKFTPLGQYIAKWGSNGTGNGQFNKPSGIAVDQNGNIYVAEYANHRVQKFDKNGTFLAKWGKADCTAGSGEEEFSGSYALAVDESGNVYVADRTNNRIQKLAYKGSASVTGLASGRSYDVFVAAEDAAGNLQVTPVKLMVTLEALVVAPPVANPPAGTVIIGTTVTLNCATAGATIHYTTDGSEPTSGSPVYTNPLPISTTMTIKAVAVKAGMEDSAVLTAAYTVVTGDEVYVSPAGDDTSDGYSWGTAKRTARAGIDTVAAGGTVYLADGVYTGENNRNIIISKNVTIRGQSKDGTIIDGSNTAQIFTIGSGRSVTVRSVTIRNGNAQYGAVANSGSLTIDDCILKDNTATIEGGAARNVGTLTVNGSSFINNAAPGTTSGSGGAIYNDGALTISDSVFTGNRAKLGGAISSWQSASVNNSGFYGNSAEYGDGYGGAIYNNGGELNLNGGTFTGNRATNGGAVYNGYSEVLTATGCTFQDNISVYGGGAIRSDGTATVHFCRLIGNKYGSTPQDIHRGSYSTGPVDAEYNWWGSNVNPSARVSGGITVGKWLVLTITADPAAIFTGGMATVTADLRHDQTGGYYDPAGGHVPDGIAVTFGTSLGSLTPAAGATADGEITSSFTASATDIANVTATVDNQTTLTQIAVRPENCTLTYTAGEHGSIDGTSSQTVAYGEDGTEVTAVPDSGCHFVNWSDGVTAANRTDTDVTGDISVTANFAQNIALEITAHSKTKTYGEADPALTYEITGGELEEGDEVTGALARESGNNAGTYAIMQGSLAVSPGSHKYDITFIAGTLTINKAPLTVTADDKSKVYGEDDPDLTYQITSGSLVDGDAFSGALTRVAGENIGSYAIQQNTLDAGDNYNLTYISAGLTVTPRDITITAHTQSKVYGEDDPDLTYEITSGSLVGDDALSGSLSRVTGEDVGRYGIQQGSLTAGDNYNLTFVPGILEITKASLTVTADDKYKIYGEADPVLTYTVSGLRYGDEPSVVSGVVLSTVTGSAATAGTHTIIASGGTAENYTVSYVDGRLTVDKASLTVMADDKSKVYGDPDPELTYTVSERAYGEPASVVSGVVLNTVTGSAATVGTHAITATGGIAANYIINHVDGTLTVGKAELTVTANDKSKTYDGTVYIPFTAICDGFVYGEDASVLDGTLVFNGDAITAVNAGIYEDEIIPDGLSSGNYDITFVPGTLTINKAPLTVTADSKSKEYDGSTFNYSSFTVSCNGFVNSESEAVLGGELLFSGDAITAVNAGIYVNEIIASGLTSNNYNITFVPGTLTINKAVLTVTANYMEKTYDGNPCSRFSVTYTGFVNGEDETCLGGALAFNEEAINAVDAGEHDIIPSGLTSDNYEISFVPGKLEIEPANLTVTAEAKSKTYDGLAFTDFSVSYSEFAPGEDESCLGGALAFRGESTTAVNAGTYVDEIIPYGLSSDNYDITFVPGTLTINKAPLTVTADDKSKVYGEDDPALTYTLSGELFFGDTASVVSGVVLSTVTGSAATAGTHTIIASGGTAANYIINHVDGTLTVGKASLTVTADDKIKICDGQVFADFTVTYDGFADGEDASVLDGELEFTGGATTAIYAGTYEIIPGGLEAANYAIAFVSGTLTLAAPQAPPAPTNPQVNDKANTFGWTNVPGFDNVSDYEYTVNGGSEWRDCKANPQPVGNRSYAKGAVQVRVKADAVTGRPAGAALASDKRFKITKKPPEQLYEEGEDVMPGGLLPADPTTIIIADEYISNAAGAAPGGQPVEIFTAGSGVIDQIAVERTEFTTTMQFNIDSTVAAVTEVGVPAAVLAGAAGLEVRIVTPAAELELSAALAGALVAAGKGLSLTVARGGEVTAPAGATVLGTPTVINTDFTGTTLVTIPLAGIDLPAEPAAREAFLAELAVFAVHSDGEEQIINGTIVYDSDDMPIGITFTVDKFSTFAVIRVGRRTVKLTVGSTAATVDGKPYTLDAAPYITAGRTLVPVRFVSEALGADVEWIEEKRQVVIRDGGKEIVLTVGSFAVTVDGAEQALDCAPEQRPGCVFVPLRFVSETLGATVEYDAATQAVTITR